MISCHKTGLKSSCPYFKLSLSPTIFLLQFLGEFEIAKVQSVEITPISGTHLYGLTCSRAIVAFLTTYKFILPFAFKTAKSSC